MGYISTSDANTYLGTSGEYTIVAELVTQASLLIDQFCNSKNWFDATTVTNERYEYQWTWPYYFSTFPINSITYINGTAVSITEGTDYLVTWHIVEFKSTVAELSSYNTDFGYITFTYTKWYATIPDAIKSACKMLVAWLYNERKLAWVKSFTQWDLSLSFADGGWFGDPYQQYRTFKTLLAKYMILYVAS